MPAIDVDRDAAHDAAQRELSKPIYPKGSIADRIQRWIHDLLYRILEQGSSMPGGWLTITVLIILAAAALVIAVRIIRRTIRTRADADLPLFDAGQLTAAQHRETAEQLAAEGDWSGAIRHRLRAVARGLEESGVLDPAPGRTANEWAADAGERLPALTGELVRSATAFSDVTYGEQPGSASAYRLIVDLDDHVHHRRASGDVGPALPAATKSWTAAR